MLSQFSNVLIVEKSQSVTQGLDRVLSRSGFNTFKAVNENEALKFVINKPINLVLFDLSSHRLNRQRFFSILRRRRKYPLLIGLVSEKEQEKAIGAIREGVFNYITKPIQQEEVKFVFEDVIERSQKLIFGLRESFKKPNALFGHMVKQNLEQYKEHLIRLAKENEPLGAIVCTRLNQLYKVELDPLIKKIQSGVIPGPDEMDLVSKTKNEIQRIPSQHILETIKYIARIDEGYKILKHEEYKQKLEESFNRIEKKLINTKKLTDIQKKNLQNEMKEIEEKLFLYGH